MSTLPTGSRLAAALLILCAAGCSAAPAPSSPDPGATQPSPTASSEAPNPSFPLTSAEADKALDQMETKPVKLARPVVVLTGYRDVGIGWWYWVDRVQEHTGDDRVIGVSFFLCCSFDDCRDRVISAVEKAYPSTDPKYTTEVDVIGLSMGGLVAHYCALPRNDGGKSLKIARLFTISTPHRGAGWAGAGFLDPLAGDMKAGSEFMTQLNAAAAKPGYPIYAYVQTNDQIVGAANAAAPGKPAAWWIEPEMPLPAHAAAMADPRIAADILRRIRNEPAWAKDPPAPLPGN